MFWLMALFTTCGTVAAMPNALHDVPGPSEPSFGPFAFALGLMGASALLRARDIDSSDAMLSFVGLGLLLVLIEVPSRQPSRR
jgi:hypothetical protein